MKFRTLLIVVGLALMMVSCAAEPTPLLYKSWKYTDLRLLDAVDASTPTLDILAAYLRMPEDQVQVRIDLLDHSPTPDYDLYLALDAMPGGVTELPIQTSADLAWDTLLIIPADGPIQVLDADMQPRHGSGLTVLRDPILDIINLSLNREALSKAGRTTPEFGLQIFITPAGASTTADQIGPLKYDAFPPTPARTLFVFSNSYPAYTPLTALRRWDGAHTGPHGGRHGLSNLLKTAQASGIPLVLLDLKNPAWISALDFTGQREIMDEMIAAGSLILPDVLPDPSYAPIQLPDWAAATMLENNHQAAGRFGIPSSPFLYSPNGSIPSGSEALLVFTQAQTEDGISMNLQPVTVTRWRDRLVLPVPTWKDDKTQATLDGPSIEVRRALIKTALLGAAPNSQEAPILILGGELPASALGDPMIARNTFRYINAHPWIHPLSVHDLLTTRPAAASPFAPIIPSRPSTLKGQEEDSLLSALRDAPLNPLGEAAWGAFSAQFAPIYPATPLLPNLRSGYLGDIWSLLNAAQWAQARKPIFSCELDPDHDGEPECVLASEVFYTQFEIQGGALTHAFAFSGGDQAEQVHQLVAPSSQLISGLSDPIFWDLEAGAAADPAVIPGAFSEAGMDYKASLEADRLVFISTEDQAQKSYRLIPGGLEVAYKFPSRPPFPVVGLSITLDPWERFNAGWESAYHGKEIPGGYSWRWEPASRPGFGVQILTSSDIVAQSFGDSLGHFAYPEDPNKDYPPGHKLPFPMALIEIQATEGFKIIIKTELINR